MNYKDKITAQIFNISNRNEFENLAISIFKFQYENQNVYREYCGLINRKPIHVKGLIDIPFLPIDLFKTRKILVNELEAEHIFKSSGTKNELSRSTHYISDLALYEQSFQTSFQKFLGNPSDYNIYTLLPGYNENPNSSLIYMVNYLGRKSRNKKIENFSNDPKGLIKALNKSNEGNRKSILFGVSFALLDFADKIKMDLPLTTIIETGGMKGKRREITRTEMHSIIKKRLNPGKLVSEYGMTELLSQAYAINEEWFLTPTWVKVLARDIHDPFLISEKGSGAINIIDLANINSCSFIATDDLVNIQSNGKFSVLGRFDHSDIRGCNLLFQEH